jgi:hypothetical protein
MNAILKLEEFAQFAAAAVLLALVDVPWWTYALLVLGPDIGMLGYLIGTRTGAFTYNLFHHKGVAVAVALVGLWQTAAEWTVTSPWLIAGIILWGHSAMDRLFGYGLKHPDHFKHTHLGWIGGAAKGA